MFDFMKSWTSRPVFAAVGDGAAGAAAAEPTAAAAAAEPATAAAAASGGKWWEGGDYSPEDRNWLAARGLAEDDPVKALPKLIKGHRAAEQRIGKGLDMIMDKPAKGQAYAEWAGANRAALGLPDKEDAYTATAPEGWPKDAPWDATLEAQARKVAFDNGVSPDAHKAYVGLFADKMKALSDVADQGLAAARETMMADLRRDLGDRTDATITGAKQAAQFFAEKAGLDAQAIEGIGELLSQKVGDAGTIRFMAAIRSAMGEDSAVAIGSGGPLTMTPADARAELARQQNPGGAYYEATAKRNLVEMDRLKPRIAQLTKIAAG